MRGLFVVVAFSVIGFANCSKASIIIDDGQLRSGNNVGHQIANSQSGSYLRSYYSLLHGKKTQFELGDRFGGNMESEIAIFSVHRSNKLGCVGLRTAHTNQNIWSSPFQLGKARFTVPVASKIHTLVRRW